MEKKTCLDQSDRSSDTLSPAAISAKTKNVRADTVTQTTSSQAHDSLATVTNTSAITCSIVDIRFTSK